MQQLLAVVVVVGVVLADFPGLLVLALVEVEVIPCTDSIDCLLLLVSYLNLFQLPNKHFAAGSDTEVMQSCMLGWPSLLKYKFNLLKQEVVKHYKLSRNAPIFIPDYGQ